MHFRDCTFTVMSLSCTLLSFVELINQQDPDHGSVLITRWNVLGCSPEHHVKPIKGVAHDMYTFLQCPRDTEMQMFQHQDVVQHLLPVMFSLRV